MRPKVLFSSEISKDLQIVDQWLTTSSLVIQYVWNGMDHTMDLQQDEAIAILKKYGIIEDERMLDVKVFDDKGDTIWVPWDDFAINYTLTEEDAKEIICGELSERSLSEWANGMRSIPSLIEKNCKPEVHPVFQQIIDTVFPNPKNFGR